MNTQLQANCDKLVENKNKLGDVFSLTNGSILLITAALLSCIDKDIPEERLKECKQLLKDNASLFSEYRGYSMVPLVAYMAASENPEKILNRIKLVYESLTKFFPSAHNLMAALSIVDRCPEGGEEAAVERMNTIRKALKEQYDWSVKNEMMPYLALMATSGKAVEDIIKDAAECYEKLNIEHIGKAEREALASVLAMKKEAVEGKCAKAVEQAKLMKMNKFRFFNAPDRVLLGILPHVDTDLEKVAADIDEIDDYLKGKKGCNWISVDGDIRKGAAMLLAALSGGKKEDYEADVLLDAALKDIMETELAIITAGVVAAQV